MLPSGPLMVIPEQSPKSEVFASNKKNRPFFACAQVDLKTILTNSTQIVSQHVFDTSLMQKSEIFHSQDLATNCESLHVYLNHVTVSATAP